MKILVLSDSHGRVENAVQAVEITRPDAIFHLGDGWRDAQELSARFPDIPLTQVPGNCDFGTLSQAELLVCLEGHTLLLAHGHTLSVKQSLLPAMYRAQEVGAEMLLYGHTHFASIDERNGIFFLNPGSIGDYSRPFYGIVTVENGKLDARTVPLYPPKK